MAHETMSLMLPLLADRVELVISNNDSMALNESGFNLPDGDSSWRIPVVGVDAVLKTVEVIRKIMSGAAVQDGKGMGKAVAAMMLNGIMSRDYLDGLHYAWVASGIAIWILYSPYTGAE